MTNQFADNERFLEIIDQTPLVAIDIILENDNGEILLGKRVNRPAKGFWFVPGGRIRKNETIAVALERISETELGFAINREEGKLLGTYDHIYPDNFLSVDGINTHYVVIAFQIIIKERQKIVPDSQHSGMEWWNRHDLLQSDEVHANTKAYFL